MSAVQRAREEDRLAPRNGKPASAQAPAVRSERQGRVALLSLANPPVNVLTEKVRAGLLAGARAAIADPDVDAVVIAAEGRLFSAGADIAEFAGGAFATDLNDVVDAFERSPKPVVIALNGVAVGGALELAMGCHWRIAAPGTRFALPEIKLGLLPGSGGTQRLPRLAGTSFALDVILSGRFFSAEEAFAAGCVEELAPDDLVGAAVSRATTLAAVGAWQRTRDLAPVAEPEVLAAVRDATTRRDDAVPAHSHCIDAVEMAWATPFDRAMARERELFWVCYETPESRALIHGFFALRRARRSERLGAVAPRRWRRAVVVGSTPLSAAARSYLDATGLRLIEASTDAGSDPVDLALLTDTAPATLAAAKGAAVAILSDTHDWPAVERVLTTADRFFGLCVGDRLVELVFPIGIDQGVAASALRLTAGDDWAVVPEWGAERAASLELLDCLRAHPDAAERRLLALVAAGFGLIDAGVVETAAAIDVLAVRAGVVPAREGGPMHQVSRRGASVVLAQWRDAFPAAAPPPSLVAVAASSDPLDGC